MKRHKNLMSNSHQGEGLVDPKVLAKFLVSDFRIPKTHHAEGLVDPNRLK
jgi:hypothetical protein